MEVSMTSGEEMRRFIEEMVAIDERRQEDEDYWLFLENIGIDHVVIEMKV
jgi:hypothetical protein